MKIAATPWFDQLISSPYHELVDQQIQGDDWDIIAIEFYDCNYQQHFPTIERLKKSTKKLVVVETEPIARLGRDNFLSYARLLKDLGITLYSDTICPDDLSGTAISWFVTNDNYYQDQLPHWQDWKKKVFDDLVYGFDRPFAFDCLLGGQRPHRDVLADFYETSKHRSSMIFNYFKDDLHKGTWMPGIMKLDSSLCSTAGLVDYFGQQVPLSCILPTHVYNQSYYSIVAETTCDNSYSHFTEKVAKPILARRPFIVVAGQHYLKNLRSLGFQTFDGLIDETYDTIENPRDRIKAAWREIEIMCQRDPETVYRVTQKIREHNFHHFMETDWYQDLRQEFCI